MSLQLNHAVQRQKTLFENVNIDWNLTHEEASTDFSDDETIIEERVSYLSIDLLSEKQGAFKLIFFSFLYQLQNGCSTPEKKLRSRPPSYAGGTDTGVTDSPVTLRSRSSTCDSLQSGLSPGFCTSKEQMPPPPPPQIKKPVIGT